MTDNVAKNDVRRFFTRPRKPLTGPLFNVAEPASCCDRVWQHVVREDVASALETLVLAVGRLHRETPADQLPTLSGPALGHMQAYCRIISQRLDREVSPDQVRRVLWRFLWTFGYVVDDPGPGPKTGWPMPGPAVTSRDDVHRPQKLFDVLLEDVANAMRGSYPEPAHG